MHRLDPQLRQALAAIRAGGEATWYVLTAYILHANLRGRAWPSLDTLCRETGYARQAVVAARVWLVEHGALSRVSYALRIGDERGSPRAEVMQLSGVIRVEGRTFRTIIAAEDEPAPEANRLPGILSGAQWSGAQTIDRLPAIPEVTAATASSLAHSEGRAEPLITAVPALRPILAAWEQEARQPLTPVLAEVLGELVERFGAEQVAEGVREAIRTTGPGKFSVKYVLRILERWELEAANGLPKEHREQRRPERSREHRPRRIRPDFSAGRTRV